MAKKIVWTDQARADVRAIGQPTALQILKTLARCAESGEGNTKMLKGVDPPVVRLRAQDHRIFSATTANISRSPVCSIAKKLIAK
jgi:hypothetical protein